ncbi:helix-turn-helix transcriptional regulator [Natronobiforma cellulositropha]|uniref:helix-turn-helix transcriptional regulator n=1 Tax=Natronobiforma cellulositropha TaxID=1679076 RepID=UPI0021D5F257|nr:hypothetical protein [Natronobiforma cellulositropha]
MGYEWGRYLLSSPHRLEVLQALEPPGADTRDLTDSLSISRVTVQRHLNRFADAGWIEKRAGRYVRTPLGEHVFHTTMDFLVRLSLLECHEMVVSSFAGFDETFDPLFLSDATVSVATESAPHGPISHYRKGITAAEPSVVHGIMPVFSELLTEVHARLLAEGVETELIVPRHVLETAPPIEDVPDASFSLFVLEQPVEFGLTVTDTAVFVGGYADRTFVTCVESTDPDVRTWASSLYESYRDQATQVPLENVLDSSTRR